MESTNELVQAAKAALGVEKDSAFARRIGVSRQTVSHWKTGTNCMTAKKAAELAKLIGIDPRDAVLMVLADQAKTETERRFWKNLLSTLSVVCFGIALAFSVLQTAGDSSMTCQFIHYAQYGVLAWFLTVGALRVNKPSGNHAERTVFAALA